MRLQNPELMVGFLILGEFIALALLGVLLYQLFRLQDNLDANRPLWLSRLRTWQSQLKRLRRQLETAAYKLPLSPPLHRKWQLFRWIAKGFQAARTARP